MGEAAKVIPLPKKKGFGDALKATKTTVKKSAKKDERTLQATEEIKAEIDRYVKAKKNMKVAESEMGHSHAVIVDFILPKQHEDGYKNKFSTSYAVEGNEEKVKFVSQNRYSINAEDDGKIAEILAESYDELIKENHTVKLRDEVLEDDALQERLMELVGDDFATFFETVTKLGVTTDFNRNIYRVVDKEKLADLHLYCRPYKPALR
ncbi:hypothetical protein KAR91_38180 [Candidatus Pacearchaeota archaeon]|nr:hypothetical protein [Candidatus Pacearchaeota archaeon]